MAAYGALVSVMQIMDQLHRHPRPPISIHKEQSESLTSNVTFLQQFLEGYNPHVSYTAEVDPLESRIAKAAYAAEDVIESYIVDQIHSPSSEEISSTQFYQGLQKVIEEMDVIKMEVKKKMKEKMKIGVQIIKKSTTTDAAATFQSSSTTQKVTSMVGLDEVLIEMLDKITGGGVDRQIIPIVGMGGLGKTTLARNIYANQLVKEHFDIRAWSTISQVHDARKILSEILTQVSVENWGDLSERDLGEKLYKYLIGRRYFIVMDDMWSIEAWDVVRRFFPNNENGSRIVVTTRLSNLASQFSYSNGHDMKFMDDANSWNLFTKTVFGEEMCPLELEGIGKKIVKGCKGLPLSIVVVGGLLSKSEPTQENWELIEKNLNSTVNLQDEGSCLQILYTSYNNLPCYIKPCFLYLGIFDEDMEIPIQFLFPLMVAEGFIKPFEGKSLEEVAEDCMEELVERNLVIVEKRNRHGKLKVFKIHDMLRDVCLREAEKDKFLFVSGEQSIPKGGVSCQHRIAVSSREEYPQTTLLQSLEPSPPLVRSWLGKFRETISISSLRLLRVCMGDSSNSEEENSTHGGEQSIPDGGVSCQRRIAVSSREEYPPTPLLLSLEPSPPLVRSWLGKFRETISISSLRLLRVCMVDSSNSEEESSTHGGIFNPLVNLRIFSIDSPEQHPFFKTPSSFSLLWNLQTLFLSNIYVVIVLEIWKMPQIRHIITYEGALDAAHCLPPLGLSGDDEDDVVLENLQTLCEVWNLKFCEGVLKRIPNVKTLKLDYYDEALSGEDDYYLNNLCCLHKLEYLRLGCMSSNFENHTLALTLPYSLKELVLKKTKLPWEEMKTKIGSLPLLEVLELKRDSFIGSDWETVEGQFSRLTFLLIENCDLECWTTDNTHFPLLEHLVLRFLSSLSEIPLSIGDIATLRSIQVEGCSESTKDSARGILEEQEELGNEDLHVQFGQYDEDESDSE